MEVGHDTLAGFAKSWGLFYLMGLFLVVVVYALWPGNRRRFDRAKHSILEDDDRPAPPPDDGPGDERAEKRGDERGEQPCR